MKDLASERPEDQDAWYHDPLGAYVEQTEQAVLLDALAPRPGEAVVDVNAGTGRLARRFALAGAHVIAVEPSESLQSLGKRRTDGLAVEWRSGYPEELPVEDAAANAVLLVTVLEFVREPERVLAEVRRVLKPGGRLVAGGLCALSPWAALYRHLGAHDVGPWASARLWGEGEFAGLLDVPDDAVRSCVYLAPNAQPPYPEADAAGRRAGNHAAFLVATWTKP